MKSWCLSAVVLLALGGQAAAATPRHIISLMVCTDAMLMELVPPSRIASISYLSREKAALKLWPEAAALPVNHNSAEEVLAQHPDLVLTLPYASTSIKAMLEKTGTAMIEVPEAQNFDDIRANLRRVGDAVGARPRAEQLIAHMDATLHALDAGRPRQPIRVAGWGGGGFVPGRDSLFNAVLDAAGATNIAGPGGGYYDVEGLVAARPDVLAYGDDYIAEPSLRLDQDAHPLLLKLFGRRRIVYPSALLGCGLPQSADAAATLRAQLLAVMKQPGGVP
jgi:iron complex transport system substrate-binding protein